MDEQELFNLLLGNLTIKLSDEWTGWENDTHILKVELKYKDILIDSDYIDVKDIR